MGTNARTVTRITEAIADELRARRARTRVTVSDLSERSGVPRSTLSRLLSGKRAIDVDEFIRICHALNANPADVIADIQDTTNEVLHELASEVTRGAADSSSHLRVVADSEELDSTVWEEPAAAHDPGSDDAIELEQEGYEELP